MTIVTSSVSTDSNQHNGNGMMQQHMVPEQVPVPNVTSCAGPVSSNVITPSSINEVMSCPTADESSNVNLTGDVVEQDLAVTVVPIPSVVMDDRGQGDRIEQAAMDQEPEFPCTELAKLEEKINRPRWVVPVLPRDDLEVLLEASIRFCKEGLDIHCEPCQRFFREGLTISFNKILTDEAVTGWKYEIQKYIMRNAEKLIELCVAKLSQDCFPLLELLSLILNPHCKFHVFNSTRQSETLAALSSNGQLTDDSLFARPLAQRSPRGWLVDLLNRFGHLDGFSILLDRFMKGPPLSVPLIYSLLKPFGLCAEILTINTVQKYFTPIVEIVTVFLDSLTDEELKKESKAEVKNDALSFIIKNLKQFVNRVPGQEETMKSLGIFRLKIILRLLQISSFNGKMNALNEVNKVITNIAHNVGRHSSFEDEWLTADKMVKWIQEHHVLSIVLRDSLHQPQYVEKLEKILRFMIKEKALTTIDLDRLWEAQSGKHDAIVMNVHDLLAKVAWDFTPDQLDHLFTCFQCSWIHATNKQREKLLELIRRLAEDDKEGVMAHKVLMLLCKLAHSADVPTEIMDQALAAHIKILGYNCSQDRDALKMEWITHFVEEVKNDRWVLPAFRQIQEICCLFSEAPPSFPHSQGFAHAYYRNNVIIRLQEVHSIIVLVSQNLYQYMVQARQFFQEHPNADPADILPDGRFNHISQVQERLQFLRFLLKDGQLWLREPQASQIWHSLTKNAAYISDMEACFQWFAMLMGDDSDLDPEITCGFFESNILQLEASLLTENGIICFDRFFKHVNVKRKKLHLDRHGGCLMDDVELIGLDYLWRVVLMAPDDVAPKAVQLLKDVFTNLGPRLLQNQLEIHEDFFSSCFLRLHALYDTVRFLDMDECEVNLLKETERMVRILNVLKEYIAECDEAYREERTILPLSRASIGRLTTFRIRNQNSNRQLDGFDILSHQNETVAAMRRGILHEIKATSNCKIELYVDGELLDPCDDKKLISQTFLRDKMILNAKLVFSGSNMPSSPDSSSDSSVGSPHSHFDGPNVEVENSLPGVILSRNQKYSAFLLQLSDLGCKIQHSSLRDGARAVLHIMPADSHLIQTLQLICQPSHHVDGVTSDDLTKLLFNNSPTQTMYNVQVCYSLLMPAIDPMAENAFQFQYNFVSCGGMKLAVNMLTKNNFLHNVDLPTKRTTYLTVLKLVKLMLTTAGHAWVKMVDASAAVDSYGITAVTSVAHQQAALLRHALHFIPMPESECTLRAVAAHLGCCMGKEATYTSVDLGLVKAVMKMAWAASSCSLHLMNASFDDVHKAHSKSFNESQLDVEELDVAREALETLAVCLTLYPAGLEALQKDNAWQIFILDMVLICKTSQSIRKAASQQLFLISTKCSSSNIPLAFLITLLFSELQTKAMEHAKQSCDYFNLLCRLLNYAASTNYVLPTFETLLLNEIHWLRKVRDETQKQGHVMVENAMLQGRLGITRELLAFTSAQCKFNLGSENGGVKFIKDLLNDFIFPASKVAIKCQRSRNIVPTEHIVPVCSTPSTTTAVFDLLVALCTGCLENLELVFKRLKKIYYCTETSIQEWEYTPLVGPRPPQGFVGLKNAGATCYMNSVLQQLFMIEPLRCGILAVEGAISNKEDELFIDDKLDSETNIDHIGDALLHGDEETVCKHDTRRDYNIGILRQVQVIFGHLATSKLQYFVPQGFWKHFKLWGEPVNLREQHDALEFFNSLVDSLDEALKSLNQPVLLERYLSGGFADQKICKDCPHRYQREEAFTTLNIDIRNHQNLFESLEQYVKGDLLEGANAYRCEKCNKKVDTVKRLVIRKLPHILAIQLKRFDYDWERECAIKFNDYFEFPREFDMEPYTVQGLAKIEGEIIDDDIELADLGNTTYRLKGVVVHSGQASGGHYYSCILHRGQNDLHPKWYKFDDGDVMECRMDDDEEMRNQCFGGEYMGEVYDHMLKRSAHRRQKRWWNAYILFYERIDTSCAVSMSNISETVHKDPLSFITEEIQKVSIDSSVGTIKMPIAIERCIRRQNVIFMHEMIHFSVEYFQFIKKLLACNNALLSSAILEKNVTTRMERISILTADLGCKFLFHIGFHTKKSFRGPVGDWQVALMFHLHVSPAVRHTVASHILCSSHSRLAEYLLECPSSEIRCAFAKIVVELAHLSLHDGPFNLQFSPGLYPHSIPDHNSTLSDCILKAVLALLPKEVPEHGRNLLQYFDLFIMYMNFGTTQKHHLLQLNVLQQFMLAALDDGPGPVIKHQYADLSKLYSVISLLVRCCDVSNRCSSSIPTKEPLSPNPYADPHISHPLMPLQPRVDEILFGHHSYIKKLIEECINSEDTTLLLKFCSWENPNMSSMILKDLLCHVFDSYIYEVMPYFDMLVHVLMIEDSWQSHRLHICLKGGQDDIDSLFDAILRYKNNCQKRAYLCIKMMVNLFTICPAACEMLRSYHDLKRKWSAAVFWLNEELYQRPFAGNVQCNYNNWTALAPSNETSNSYMLERSQSAKLTLNKAIEICPEEEHEEVEIGDENDCQINDRGRGFSCGTVNGNHQNKTTSYICHNQPHQLQHSHYHSQQLHITQPHCQCKQSVALDDELVPSPAPPQESSPTLRSGQATLMSWNNQPSTLSSPKMDNLHSHSQVYLHDKKMMKNIEAGETDRVSTSLPTEDDDHDTA